VSFNCGYKALLPLGKLLYIESVLDYPGSQGWGGGGRESIDTVEKTWIKKKIVNCAANHTVNIQLQGEEEK